MRGESCLSGGGAGKRIHRPCQPWRPPVSRGHGPTPDGGSAAARERASSPSRRTNMRRWSGGRNPLRRVYRASFCGGSVMR